MNYPFQDLLLKSALILNQWHNYSTGLKESNKVFVLVIDFCSPYQAGPNSDPVNFSQLIIDMSLRRSSIVGYTIDCSYCRVIMSPLFLWYMKRVKRIKQIRSLYEIFETICDILRYFVQFIIQMYLHPQYKKFTLCHT